MMGKKVVFFIKHALSSDTIMHDEAPYGGGKISYDAGHEGIGTCTTAFTVENKYYPHAPLVAGHCLKHGAIVYGKRGSGIFLDKISTYKEYNGDVDVVVPSGEAVTEGKFWSGKTGELAPVAWRTEEPSYGQWLAVKGELSGRQYVTVQRDVRYHDAERKSD